jgi:D-serine dehydratase
MNLKPQLLDTMTTLGVTEPELDLLRSRMLGAVTGLQAQLSALDMQIATLQAQRDAVAAELGRASVTVGKLIDMTDTTTVTTSKV